MVGVENKRRSIEEKKLARYVDKDLDFGCSIRPLLSLKTEGAKPILQQALGI